MSSNARNNTLKVSWYIGGATIHPKRRVFIGKTNRTVVRNQAYRKSEFNIRKRHNERKNDRYGNGDIIPDRTSFNIHFKSCNTTYEQEFNRLVEEGIISLRSLKPNAKVFDELVFDVNSSYFENHGGYEYAKEFFAEAYKLAIKEAGGEEYILSAVLHADERNKALSEEYKRDVFHYHLHVVYIPVVDKEIYFKKNNPDPELAGKLREVIKQVSHSKKWPRYKDDDGHWVNSYSLLQDRFYEHMKSAGYSDFERGERGSTAQHLSVLEYKTQQETERLTAISNDADQHQAQLDALKAKTVTAKEESVTFLEIERMSGKRTITGNVSVSPSDWKSVSNLAKEGIKSRGVIATLKEQTSRLSRENSELRTRLQDYEGSSVTDTIEYFQAKARAPKRLASVIADIHRNPPEKSAPEQHQSHDKHLVSR